MVSLGSFAGVAGRRLDMVLLLIGEIGRLRWGREGTDYPCVRNWVLKAILIAVTLLARV